MPVFTIYPLTDGRWDELVSQHHHAGVFHSSSWLSALQRTYGFEPVALTTCPPGESLRNALVFCKVKSWITGRRLISLPFSDHCDLLADSPAQEQELLAHVCELVARDRGSHLELRPLRTEDTAWSTAMSLQPSKTFCLHKIQLDEPIDTLFRNLHRSCIQRKIRCAEKEALAYDTGHSESLLSAFYELQLQTRRRHGVPPQPIHWFRNLASSMGDKLTIRLVSKNNRPVAAMLTLSHKTTVTYKYGCSDERFHGLGGVPFLFWKTIQESKSQGMQVLDLGRSDLTQPGLIEFKDRLGGIRTTLTYWRYPRMKTAAGTRSKWPTQIARGVFAWIPEPIFVASGRFLYKHIG